MPRSTRPLIAFLFATALIPVVSANNPSLPSFVELGFFSQDAARQLYFQFFLGLATVVAMVIVGRQVMLTPGAQMAETHMTRRIALETIARVACMAFCMVAAANAFGLMLSPMQTTTQTTAYAAQYFTLDRLGLPLIALSVIVVAPIIEELLFRGVIFGALRTHFNFKVAAIISSIIFAAAHYNSTPLLLMVLLFIDGLIFAWLREKTGLFSPVILAHALLNSNAFLNASGQYNALGFAIVAGCLTVLAVCLIIGHLLIRNERTKREFLLLSPEAQARVKERISIKLAEINTPVLPKAPALQTVATSRTVGMFTPETDSATTHPPKSLPSATTPAVDNNKTNR